MRSRRVQQFDLTDSALPSDVLLHQRYLSEMGAHLAFLPSLPLPLNPTTALSRTRPSVTSRPRPRKRARTRAAALPNVDNDDDQIPRSIRALDMLELQRRENLPPPEHHLDPAAKEALFRDFPALARVEAQLAKEMAKSDYDPEDHRVYSWAYRYLRPWAPSRLLQFLISALVASGVAGVVTFVRDRYRPFIIARNLLFVDKWATISLAGAAPALFLIWAFVSARSKKANTNDGLRRSVFMFAATAPILAATWMITSSSNLVLGLAAGIMVRLHLAASLWIWADLRREIFLSSVFVAPFFRIWRFLTTAFVIIAGCMNRIIPIFVNNQLPMREEFFFRANTLRLELGARFPVALSLCNDQRGLFLLGAIICISLLVHGLYLFIFASDFLQNRDHRRFVTPMTHMMVKWGLYQPNVHPDEIKGSLSAPDTHQSFLPSAPMLLRRDEVMSPDSMLVDEAIMPVMAYLDKEDEILRRDGMKTWLKPRTEQVPITKELSYEKRSLDALYTWSRPLLEDDEDKSFMDFFETLEDDEYVYDPITGNWIFENAGNLGDNVVNGREVQEDSAEQVEVLSETDLDKEEGVLQSRIEGDSLVLEVPSEMEPWLRRFVEEEGTKDDDRDDPSVPVYV